MLDLTTIPLIDNHCHSLLREQPQTPEAFRACFTESYFSEIARQHVEHTVLYQWALAELGEFYHCAPATDAVLAAVNSLNLSERARNINRATNTERWLVDFGYSTAETFGRQELETIAGVAVENVLRLEPLIEELILDANTFQAFYDAFVNALQDLRGQGYISLKSILAYRSGLNIGEPSDGDIRACFGELKELGRRDGKIRVASKPLLDYLIPVAVEIAARQEFPIQFHTGFGDPDQDLTTSNPALLRPLFIEKYRGAKLVLLHAGYPYARTLGYLASVYPNVYADFGLAIPFVTGEATSILRELLGLAPASKILYSSDAFHIPELYYLGAVLGRRALAEVLMGFVNERLLSAKKAEEMAQMILRGNAQRVYNV
jgi:hypothetical protein